jgi:hypothetical protein
MWQGRKEVNYIFRRLLYAGIVTTSRSWCWYARLFCLSKTKQKLVVVIFHQTIVYLIFSFSLISLSQLPILFPFCFLCLSFWFYLILSNLSIFKAANLRNHLRKSINQSFLIDCPTKIHWMVVQVVLYIYTYIPLRVYILYIYVWNTYSFVGCNGSSIAKQVLIQYRVRIQHIPWGILLCSAAHTGESYSAVLPTLGSLPHHCCTHSQVWLTSATYTGESYSAVLPTLGSLPHHCCPHSRVCLISAAHTGDPASAELSTLECLPQQCFPHWGVYLNSTAHTGESA